MFVHLCFLKHFNTSHLFCHTLALTTFSLHLCLFPPQDTEPEPDSYGRSGHLQFVLYAALAVCPVCAAHPGKHGKINIVRECGGEWKGSTEIKEKIETWREQRTGSAGAKKSDAGQHGKEIK